MCVLTGVTQELIDEVRASTENSMLSDVQNILNNGGDLECRGSAGETPVSNNRNSHPLINVCPIITPDMLNFIILQTFMCKNYSLIC